MTYIKVYKYSARRWQPGILNVRIRKYFSDSCFGSPEFFGICSTSLSLTPRHDPHEALSHWIPKSKQADENNEWIASNRILAFTRRFLGSPRGKTLQLTKKDCMVTDVPSSQVEKKQTINSWIHNSFYFLLVCDVARHCFLVYLDTLLSAKNTIFWTSLGVFSNFSLCARLIHEILRCCFGRCETTHSYQRRRSRTVNSSHESGVRSR